MAIITSDLSQQIINSPEKDYSVIITVKGDHLPAVLESKGKFIMGREILSAQLTGIEIQKLVSDDRVETIEADMEMGIL